MPKAKKVKFNVQFDEDTMKRLEKEAEKQPETSVGHVIRQLVWDGLNKTGKE